MLAEIFQRQVGRSIFAEFTDHLARPLGMEDVRPNDTYFELEPGQSRYPAYEFRISARDLARIGVLYLQDGRWNGLEIVPAAWIRESLRPHTAFDERAGYGYLWWINPGTYQAPDVRSVPFAHARPAPPERTVVQVDPATYDALVGSYEVKPGVAARVFKYEGRLFVNMPGRGEAELFPSGRDEFFLRVVDVVIRFTRDDNGNVNAVTVDERGSRIIGRKVG